MSFPMGNETVRVFRHAHMAGGIGGGARGFGRANPRIGNVRARYECAGSIDIDAEASLNFENMTGHKGTVMDLFSLEQYERFHGRSPPAGWREASPADIFEVFGPAVDVAFASYPCKGFSGLLSTLKSETEKYQALNALTLRGMWLLLEAYKGQEIPIILFENVPRIATRGRWLLDQIIALLRHYGYHVAEDTHDCGEIGGLAQSRKRFLLIARHPELVPPFVYEPVIHRLRGVGEVLGKMPMPGDPVGGPMHRVPALQWKTWVRLAFVPAGKDWRALNDLVVEEGVLRDYGIVPEVPQRDNALGVCRWNEDQAPTIIGNQRSPYQGRFSVADPRPVDSMYRTSLGVTSWFGAAGTIGGRGFPLNGAYSVADPRTGYPTGAHHNLLAVMSFGQPSKTVTGATHVTGSALSVADPRTFYGPSTHPNVLGVVPWQGKATGTITANPKPTSGAHCVADPRVENGHPRSVQLGVRAWNQTAACVKGDMSVGTGPYAVADVRLPGKPRFNNVYRIVPFASAAPAVAGPGGPANGLAVADPRADEGRHVNGKYRVTAFDQPANSVIAASTTGNGAYVVADPRCTWGEDRHRNIFRITPYTEPVGTVPANAHSVTGGQPCVQDPRLVEDPRPVCLTLDRTSYLTQGHYGVLAWGETAGAVPAFAKNNNGRWSVADPREDACEEEERFELPLPNERLVCRIISLDETWHRPFTTLELAALQSLFDPEEVFERLDDGWLMKQEFKLEARSDAKVREWIGNAVPSDAAKGMAETIGEALLAASMGETFQLSAREIWVKPGALALTVNNDQPAFRLDLN